MKTIEDIMTREKFVNCMLYNLHTHEYNSYGYSAKEEYLASLYEMLYDKELDKMYKNFISSMPYGKDFFKLAEIGGCKQYHQEGNALEHTLLVAAHMWTKFYSQWAFEVGLLHDIGKIYTGIPKPDWSGDWEYPWHSVVGGIPGILQRFIKKEHPLFSAYSWFITNHIKPLFWVNKSQEELHREIDVLLKSVPKGHEELCTINNLVTLVLCDLNGSIGKDSNEETINFLNNLK